MDASYRKLEIRYKKNPKKKAINILAYILSDILKTYMCTDF